MSDEQQIPEPEVDNRPTNPWSQASMAAAADVESEHQAIEELDGEPEVALDDEVAAASENEGDDEADDHAPRSTRGSKLANPRRIRTVDFRRPTKFSRDQMRRLEGAHDGFCRGASTRLSAELRTGVEIAVTTSD